MVRDLNKLFGLSNVAPVPTPNRFGWVKKGITLTGHSTYIHPDLKDHRLSVSKGGNWIHYKSANTFGRLPQVGEGGPEDLHSHLKKFHSLNEVVNNLVEFKVVTKRKMGGLGGSKPPSSDDDGGDKPIPAKYGWKHEGISRGNEGKTNFHRWTHPKHPFHSLDYDEARGHWYHGSYNPMHGISGGMFPLHAQGKTHTSLDTHLNKFHKGDKSISEDTPATNAAGDGSNIAGLDNNPPGKKKKLGDILRRRRP